VGGVASSSKAGKKVDSPALPGPEVALNEFQERVEASA
jgi:hypothetical protein